MLGRTRPCHLLPLSWPSWVPAGPVSGRSLCSRWRLPKRKATTSSQHTGAAGLPGPLWHRAPRAHITQPALGSLSSELGLQPRCLSVMPGRGHRRHKMVPVVLAERFCRAGAVLGMTEGDVPRPSCWAEWCWGRFLIPCQGHSSVMGTFRARGVRRGAAGPPLTSVGSRHPRSPHLFTGDPVKKRLSSGHKQRPVITLPFRN